MDMIALRIACGVVLAATLLVVVWRIYRDEINVISDDQLWTQFHEHILPRRKHKDGRDS